MGALDAQDHQSNTGKGCVCVGGGGEGDPGYTTIRQRLTFTEYCGKEALR